MRSLLDTNVISETIRERPDRNVTNWFDGQLSESAWISVITLAEIKDGIDRTVDTEKQRHLAYWLQNTVMTSWARQVLPLHEDVLIDWFRISRQLARKGVTRQAQDLLLASTARVHGLVLITRNIRHFANTGITVYNPWTDETQTMEAP